MIEQFQTALVDRLDAIGYEGDVNVYPSVPRDPDFPYVAIDQLTDDVLAFTDDKTVYEVTVTARLIDRYPAGEVNDRNLKKDAKLIEDAMGQTLTPADHVVLDASNRRDIQYITEEQDAYTYVSALIRFQYTVEDEPGADDTAVYNPPERDYTYGAVDGITFEADPERPSITFNASLGQWLASDGTEAVPIGGGGGGVTVPGADRQLIFNDQGSLGADAGLTFDGLAASIGIPDNRVVVGTQTFNGNPQPVISATRPDGRLFVDVGGDRVQVSGDVRASSDIQGLDLVATRNVASGGTVSTDGAQTGTAQLGATASPGQTEPLLSLRDETAADVFGVGSDGTLLPDGSTQAASGSFTAQSGETVTVTNGVITDIS